MSLRLKLVVIVLFVAVVPLAISAFTTLRLHQRAFEQRTAELYGRSTGYGAALVQATLERSAQTLVQAARAVSWPELSSAERDGALWLLYRQLDDLAVVSLLDEHGQGVGPSAYLDSVSNASSGLGRHPTLPSSALGEFAAHLPFERARAEGLAFGEVFVAQGVDGPLLPIALTVDGPQGTHPVVAAALSLRGLCRTVAEVGTGGAVAYLVDPGHRMLCRHGAPAALTAADPAVLAIPPVGEGEFQLVELTAPAAKPRIAARAQTPSGWSIVVEQDAGVAYAANSRILWQSVFWLAAALVIAAATGLLLAGSIIRPVRRLLSSAQAVAAGKLDQRLPVESGDELGQLSAAFNHMSGQIQTRDREIRGWNQQLQQRVEERTRELREAQEQLLHSQKMAAVTGLGAGFAHEINNPLSAVLGLTQVLLFKARRQHAPEDDLKVLRHIEEQSLRIGKIVRTVLSLSQHPAGDGFAELEVERLIDESVVLVQGKLAEAQIQVVKECAGGLPPILGNAGQLRQALVNVINNAQTAMRERGGTLKIASSLVGGQAVRLDISDTGRGIPPEHLGKIFDPFFTTKDDWKSQGLGLTVVSRVVEAHKGRVSVQSEPGRGTTLSITLPVAPARAHLV